MTTAQDDENERSIENFIELLTIRSQSLDSDLVVERLHRMTPDEVIIVAALSIGFQIGFIESIAESDGITLAEAIARSAGQIWSFYYGHAEPEG